jgi:hypothetical protein
MTSTDTVPSTNVRQGAGEGVEPEVHLELRILDTEVTAGEEQPDRPPVSLGDHAGDDTCDQRDDDEERSDGLPDLRAVGGQRESSPPSPISETSGKSDSFGAARNAAKHAPQTMAAATSPNTMNKITRVTRTLRNMAWKSIERNHCSSV